MLFYIKDPVSASGRKSVDHDKTISVEKDWATVVAILKEINVKRSFGFAYVKFGNTKKQETVR